MSDVVTSFDLSKVVFNWHEESRIDKYRAGGDLATILFLAEIQDSGNPQVVVAKVGWEIRVECSI